MLFEKSGNYLSQMFKGTVEKTVQESSLDRKSQLKPFNPDDLWQRNGDYRVYEEMITDDQVSIALQMKKDLVIGSGWFFESGETGQEDIIEDLNRAFSEDIDVPFDDQLEEIVSAYEFGFSVSEKLFKTREDGSLALKILKTRHPNTWIIHTDEKGNVIRYEQQGAVKASNIDPCSLIHYINSRKFQNPYGTSDLRAAYTAWFTKTQIIRYYAIFLEKAASATPIAKYDKKANKQAVRDIFNTIKNFQAKTAMAIPKDIEVDFLQSKNSGEAYVKGINIFNMFIGRSLFIPDLLGFQGSETSGGSFALGKEQLNLFMRHIMRRRSSLEYTINLHLVKPIVQFNHGFVENYPKFKLRPISDDDAMGFAKVWIEAAKGKFYKPSVEEINHFRSLIKFPESEHIELIESSPDPFGPASGGGLPKDVEDKDPDDQDDQDDSDDQDSLPELKEIPNDNKLFKAKDLGAYDDTAGDYKNKVNFKVIKDQMENNVNKILAETEPITNMIFDDVFDQIQKKKIISNQRVDRIGDIKFKNLKSLNKVLGKNLKQHFKDSKVLAQQELFKKTFATPLPSDKFLAALEAENFDYVGKDWLFAMEKKTRVELVKAIKDGLPLSTVTDVLDRELNQLSKVSLERYARTKSTEVLNRGRQEFFDESGVVNGYQYSAILDGRTCFAPETLITMSDGSFRPIYKVKSGEYVLSGSGESRRVKACKIALTKKWRQIKTEEKEQICSTDTHPFWTLQQGGFSWLESKDIKKGDRFGRIELSSLQEKIYIQQECKKEKILQSGVLFPKKKSEDDRPRVQTVRNQVSSTQELAGHTQKRCKILFTEMLSSIKDKGDSAIKIDKILQNLQKGVQDQALRNNKKQSALQQGMSEAPNKNNVFDLRKRIHSSEKKSKAVLLRSVLSQVDRRDDIRDGRETIIGRIKNSFSARSQIGKICARLCNHEENSIRDGRLLLARENKKARSEERQEDQRSWISIDENSNGCVDGGCAATNIEAACHDVIPTPNDTIKITDIKDINTIISFCYDLEIENDHSYLVGKSRIIAHNTAICSGLHGKFFKAGSEPVPPLHFSCRSTLIPITKFEEFEPTKKIGKSSVNDFIDKNIGEGFSKK